MKKPINNILHNPLDGQKITILDHTDKNMVNLSSIIKYESKNMLILEKIKLAKSDGIFLFKVTNKKISINGKLLLGTVKQRKKKRIKNW